MASKEIEGRLSASLLCPICSEIFVKATLLDCGHTFCLGCLRNLDINSCSYSGLLCPLCAEKTNLPDHRVAGLPQNITVNSLVDNYLKRQEKLLRRSSKKQRSRKGTTSFVCPEPLTILKEISLQAGIRGMAALSPDTVAIAYGSSIQGAESFSTSGTKKIFLYREVGNARDIAILSDGRPVVSHESNILVLYRHSNTGFRQDFQYNLPLEQSNQYAICSDNQDHIYAVKNNSIYIFDARNRDPLRVVKTGKVKPLQVCVTSKGVIIITTYKSSVSKTAMVTLFDKEGHQGASIGAKEHNEYLFAAVDSDDRIFVASILPMVGILRLSTYTVKGKSLILQMKFKDLKLYGTEYIWHCMVCLSPNTLALANLGGKLYFIEVPTNTEDLPQETPAPETTGSSCTLL